MPTLAVRGWVCEKPISRPMCRNGPASVPGFPFHLGVDFDLTVLDSMVIWYIIMPTNLTAEEAARIADANAKAIRAKNEKEAKKQAAARRKADAKDRVDWRKKRMARIRMDISTICDLGCRELTETLHSGTRHTNELYGPQSYFNFFKYAPE